MTDNQPATDSAVQEDSTAETARYLTEQMLEAGGLDAGVTVTEDAEEGITVVIEGEDAALLIGKHGQTLNALQHLLSLMVKHQTGSHVRLSVDAEQYRAKRAESLIQMARGLAAEVREANEEAVMDPLNAAERRIVHTALLDEPGISTYSEGEEPQRRVVISPKV